MNLKLEKRVNAALADPTKLKTEKWCRLVEDLVSEINSADESQFEDEDGEDY